MFLGWCRRFDIWIKVIQNRNSCQNKIHFCVDEAMQSIVRKKEATTRTIFFFLFFLFSSFYFLSRSAVVFEFELSKWSTYCACCVNTRLWIAHCIHTYNKTERELKQQRIRGIVYFHSMAIFATRYLVLNGLHRNSIFSFST